MLKRSRIIWDIIFIVAVVAVPEFIAEKIGLYTSIMELLKEEESKKNENH